MADIFISYAREDREAVEKLAAELGAAGLSCWWDRQLAAGAKYRERTEAELNAAKAVLVVWTKHSIGSHWVADEAAAAQEAGKLAPITLDGSTPPLGFRQFQVIDFSRWKGGSDGPLRELATALSSFGAGAETKAAPPAPPTARFRIPPRTLAFLAAGLAALLVLAVAGWALWGRTSGAAAALEPTIAVLPFANLTGDPEKDYVARGVAVDIIERLSQLEDVKVISRNSSFKFGPDEDPRKVGQDLNVANILSGTVRQEGGRFIVSADLADARTGAAIWTQPFLRELTADDPYAVQRMVAERVAGAMSIAFDLDARPSGTGTRSLEAYDLYLHGLDEWWYKNNRSRSEKLFGQAIELDPNYADAWAARGLSIASEWGGLPPREARTRQDAGYAMAKRAVELAPDNSMAQANFGIISTTQSNWIDAEKATSRALDISRTEIVLNHRQMLLLRTGHIKAAYAFMQELRQLDPLRGPDDLGLVPILLAVGRHDELKEITSRPDWAETDNTIWSRRFFVVMTRINTGDTSASVRQSLEALAKRVDRAPAEFVGEILKVFGDRTKAREVLRSWYEDQTFQHSLKWDLLPLLAAWYGDTDLVLRIWSDELLINTGRTAYIWSPVFAPARARPEFRELVRKLGFVDYWRAYGWPDACRPLGDSDFECG